MNPLVNTLFCVFVKICLLIECNTDVYAVMTISSLGARHDGEDNPCKSEDRFIMAASGIGPVPPDKRLNPWHFSSCSVEYFRDFIASLLA